MSFRNPWMLLALVPSIYLLARHGAGHRLLPSELNFRANIYGFKMLGVHTILSASAVGSMKEEIAPGDLVVSCFFPNWQDGETGMVDHFERSPLLLLVERLATTLDVLTGTASWRDWSDRLRAVCDVWIGPARDREKPRARALLRDERAGEAVVPAVGPAPARRDGDVGQADRLQS